MNTQTCANYEVMNNSSNSSSSRISREEQETPVRSQCADNDDGNNTGSGSGGEEWSDAEVAVEVQGKRWYVSGVTENTTAEEVTQALTSTLQKSGDSSGWSLCERWRGVCRPLSPQVLVLDVCKAWGLTPYQPAPYLTHDDDVGLCLRYNDDDSGRESCTDPGDNNCQSSRRKLDNNFSRLKHIIASQSHTIHRQIDKLREREKQIGELEFEEHMTRVHKHGDNYLLDAYFRSAEGGSKSDPQSDSGVGGVEANKPHRNKHRSRRSRHLLREHYLTKELTDICQVNSTMLNQTSQSDEQHEQIYVMEKIAIINKRLQREEELLIRLESKIKRYNSTTATDDDVTSNIKLLDEKIEENQRNIENFDKDLRALEEEIHKRNSLLMSMYEELKTLDSEKNKLESEMCNFDNVIYFENNFSLAKELPFQSSNHCTYKLDTLV